MKKLLRFVLTFVLIFALVILAEDVLLPALLGGGETGTVTAETISEDGEYTQKDDLALYIHLYGHLPSNFVTKAEAEAAGWKGGAVGGKLPGKSIGGDRFYNLEGLLPKAKGRVWTECDVGDRVFTRGAERLVFSNDGLIYYTDDHYDSFELLYGEP